MPSEKPNLYIPKQQEVISLPNGKMFSFNLESGYTEIDLEFIKAFFDLKLEGISEHTKNKASPQGY